MSIFEEQYKKHLIRVKRSNTMKHFYYDALQFGRICYTDKGFETPVGAMLSAKGVIDSHTVGTPMRDEATSLGYALRDTIAIAAMQVIHDRSISYKEVAELAYDMADEMLKARDE